ncbi:hypothetical protein TL16_g01519 [Triparma laevis f. inornata]|uniref:Uncharacterized protein n=1 Tax=Triparma laevis f. inornata TaxID=1714386 RepID=A0A9W6ZG37_9STRA|nr:hypothetical protein TL16_g01519 [Triparma laevis f. inornata]
MAGSALSKLVREATIGVVLGVIGGFMWKFSITVPSKNVIDNYYKNLKKVRRFGWHGVEIRLSWVWIRPLTQLSFPSPFAVNDGF